METTDSRTVRLSTYVDLSLADALDRLTAQERGEAVDASHGERVVLRALEAERLTDHTARVPVAWHAIDEAGGTLEGSASVQLIVVQSGDEPKTELVVAFTVPGRLAPRATATARQVLDDVTARMSPAVAA